MNPVIPPRSNRKKPWGYDRELYELRHLVGNVFLHLKQWRGVATRYAKEPASFLAICQILALVLWTNPVPTWDSTHFPSADSKASLSRLRNTLCSVDTAGVLSLVNPRLPRVSGPCSLPHWAMA